MPVESWPNACASDFVIVNGKMATIFVLLEINYLSQMERRWRRASSWEWERKNNMGEKEWNERLDLSHVNTVFTCFCSICNYAWDTKNECGIQLFNINNNLCRAKCIHILRWKKSKCPLFTLSFGHALNANTEITCTQFRDKNTQKIRAFLHHPSRFQKLFVVLASILLARIWYGTKLPQMNLLQN